MPSTRPQGLLVDFGGVLTTPVGEATEAFCLSEGLAPDAFANVITEDPVGRALYADLELGRITQTEWNTRTAPLLGVEAAGLLGRVLAGLRPEPALLAAVDAARAAGIRTGLLSNGVGRAPHDPYQDYGLDTRFDAVVLSDGHGARKPDPGLYATALDLLELPAGACVFVDDSPRNLDPARDLGMTALLDTTPAETVAGLEEIFGIPLG
ncbi:HAD-IA family hydrolase [Streptomyces sp. HU2014]|uniref:HAD family hydrolase n=1 Tax=Streptomyces sp. HU2014 TaxID=2939414 RepID=UPI00200EDE06|nr:HAD-IA family hydrolase [Streptomyces sp. HU2014]UQI43971.1 HAD-IA family hydrolase [Streptomyces sp. HU2014]